jgi:serine/threonine protein kinase
VRTAYCSRCLTSFTGDPARCPNLGCGQARPREGWEGLLAAGDVLDRHYRIQDVLALAGGGVTYKARALDALDAEIGPELAIKVLYAQRVHGDHLLRLANEAQLLRHLAHPHIVECLGFAHRDGATPYLVTRFEHGGTLAEHVERVGPVRPDIAAAVVLQIVGALQQAHALGIVHRDMKPQNVLLRAPCSRDDVPSVRVADFGIAKVRGALGDNQTRAGAFVGTPEYAAPEQFEGHAPTAAADLFAVGSVFFALLTGQPAFRPTDRHDAFACLAELRAQLPPRLPRVSQDARAWEAAQAVIDVTMIDGPEARATAGELRERLESVLRLGAIDAAAGASALSESNTLAPAADSGAGWRTSRLPGPARSLTFVPDDVSAVADEPPLHVGSSWPASPVTRAGARDRTTRKALSLDDLIAGFAPASAPDPAAQGAAPPARAASAPQGTLDAEWTQPSFPRASTQVGSTPASGVDALLTELAVADDPAARRALAARLVSDARALTQAVGGLRSGGDPARSIGFCRLAVLEGRADWTSRLRTLLVDPSDEVRAAASDALGAVGTVQGLSALPALAQDTDAQVRLACARGLAWLALRHRRADLARPVLERLARDPDRDVRDGSATCLDLLERGVR